MLVKRPVDSLIMQVAVDMVREYKKDSPYFQNLPPEILNIVGKPLTAESLKELAEKDELELLLLDKVISSTPTAPLSRKQAKQRKIDLQEALLEEDLLSVVHEQPMQKDVPEKHVSFAEDVLQPAPI